MPAYLVVESVITDAAKFEPYRALAPVAVAKFGGRYLARGGNPEAVENGWAPQRLTIVEFPSREVAKKFYDSPEYTKAREARAGAATFKMTIIDGV